MYTLPPFVCKLIEKIAYDEGMSEGYRIETEPGSKPNDGIIADLIRVTVSDVATSNKLQLICKLMPENIARISEFHTDKLFAREILMYTKILPRFLAFQREKSLSDAECFLSYPKCYAAVADQTKQEYVLILEDLRPKGFSMWNCQVAPPVDHAERVVEELAKLHAISFALKDQQPDVYEKLKGITDLLHILYRDGLKTMQNEAYDRSIAVLANPAHAAKLIELKEISEWQMNAYMNEGLCEPFGVIGHGDCWTNNNMFRYVCEDNNNNVSKLAEICILDWQLARYESPALDLHDVLFVTSDKASRKNYVHLLEHYYRALQTSIRRLGTDPQQCFTFDDLMKQMKLFGKYGFCTAILSIPLIVGDVNEPKIQTAFAQRVNDLVVDFMELGYLD